MATTVETVQDTQPRHGLSWRNRRGAGLLALAAIVTLAMASSAPLRTLTDRWWDWSMTAEGATARLRWLMALLPGSIIVNHMRPWDPDAARRG
jgi:hypothetical protein